jgi:hypothetical protein
MDNGLVGLSATSKPLPYEQYLKRLSEALDSIRNKTIEFSIANSQKEESPKPPQTAFEMALDELVIRAEVIAESIKI